MKKTCLLLMLAAPSLAQADVVLDWNGRTLATIRRTSTPPPVAARTLAMVHVAIYDAVNSIDHTHQQFRVFVPGFAGASPDAAASQAAFRVLVHLYPADRVRLERARADSLARVPDGSDKLAGIKLGEIVAERVIAWRAGDGSQRSISYVPSTQPGKWRPTLPDFKPAMLPQWAQLTPFGVPGASQFRPPFPPNLTSTQYTRAWQEVKRLGAANGSTRTEKQTDTAYYWADGDGTVTPPGHWNRIARTVARSADLSVHENARLLALLNVALADAAIVCWDMKYTCNLWRPITAIREADTDGNDQTQREPTWQPLLDTPPFPSCTSGHSTFSGAASQVLALFFDRDEIRFTDTSETSRRSRTYASFSQAAEEAGRSRVYGGIHFQFDNTAGLHSGRAVGSYIFDHCLQPLAGDSANQVATRETYHLVYPNGVPDKQRTAAIGPESSTVYYRLNADAEFATMSEPQFFGSSYSPVIRYCLPVTTCVRPTVVYAPDPIVVQDDPAVVLYYAP